MVNIFDRFPRVSKLRKLFSPQDKWKIVGIICLMALSGFLEMAGLGLLAGTAALFLSPGTLGTETILARVQTFFPGFSTEGFFLAAIVAVTLLLILKNCFAFVITAFQSRFMQQKQNEFSCRMFCAYLKSDFRFFSSHSAGECSGYVEKIPMMFQNSLLAGIQTCADCIVVLFLAVTALLLMPLVTLGGVLFLLLYASAVYFATKKINTVSGERFQKAAEKESRIRLAGILGAQEIKAAGCEDAFLRRFEEPHTAFSRLFARLYTLGQLPRFMMETSAFLLASGLFVILFLSGVDKAQILLTFTILAAGMARILPALSRCHYNLTLIRQYRAMFDAITDELEHIPPEIQRTDGPIPDAGKEIRFENVTFAYSPKKPIFSGFSFSIAPGKITGMAGKSGIGKSTAAHLLLGLLRPDDGVISVGGVDVSGNLPGWRKQLGFVPQNVFLFEGSIRENILFGDTEQPIDDEKINHALALAQLPEFIGKLDEFLPAGGASLSGGQKQRLGIARALCRDPKLLILDEATSALDPATEKALCQVLEALRGKITVFLISHRESTLQICDAVIPLSAAPASGTQASTAKAL